MVIGRIDAEKRVPIPPHNDAEFRVSIYDIVREVDRALF